jgi:hypothetical protein
MMFMKWKTPGITYFGGGGSGGGKGTTNTFTSDLESLAGQTFNSQEELDAAEATQGTISDVQTQVEGVTADPQGTFNTSQQNVTNIQSQLNALNQQLEENPQLQSEIDSLTQQLNTEQNNLTQAQKLLNQQKVGEQQALMSAAVSDPSSLIERAEVATTPVSPDQFVAEGTGQTGEVETADVATAGEAETMETPARQEASTFDASNVGDAADVITEDLQAAVGEPSEKATVRGQLALLMQDFEGGETPPWASGPMRQAMGLMKARGMGASSIAGAAVVQAAMESAISIASQDATTTAQFEMQNLNNEQQTTIFKTQQRLAGLFSDQAAENAAKQFNASSENQTNQFFSNLEAASSQFNATQINAIRQFNAGETNAVSQFNATLKAQRDQFNAQNSLVIAQSNAQWRQNIATADTAANNIANLEYVKGTNAITGAALQQLWQRERDLLDYAFTSSESELDRATEIFLQKLAISGEKDAIRMQESANSKAATGAFVGNIVTQLLGFG